MSSSSGELISLPDVLSIYTPEMTRFLFTGTRPNSEFSISFDLDVLKIYEDYEKLERSYFNKPTDANKLKNWEKGARIYELSQVDGVPKQLPYQIPIRHLCNLLQIFNGDTLSVIHHLGDLTPDQIPRFQTKAACAWNWIRNFAPDDFRFSLNAPGKPLSGFSPLQRRALTATADLVREKMDSLDEKAFGTEVYTLLQSLKMESADFFPIIYQALIGKEQGPRLINFLYTIGKDTVYALLSQYSD